MSQVQYSNVSGFNSQGTGSAQSAETSDCDPRVLWIDMFRPYRVLHPLVALAVHILLCAEGYGVGDGLGSLVRYCSVRPVERYPARLSVTLAPTSSTAYK